MILTIILGIANVLFSALGAYALRLPGFDLTLIGVIIAARAGENILVASIVFTVAFCLPKPSRFSYAIIQILLAWLVGWMAVSFDMVFIPIFVFHALALIWVTLVGAFNGRHILAMLTNIGISLVIGRFYVMMS